MSTYPYAEVFRKFETGLIKYGSRKIEETSIRANFDKFKNEFIDKQFTDNDYFRKLVFVAFYSGFKAATVKAKEKTILDYFSSWEVTALYGNDKVLQMLADKKMIRFERKIRACIQNARTIERLRKEYGSIQLYIDSFSAKSSFENLMLLKESLEASFDYLGGITVYHFMTDIGLNVLKPDRVLTRIFSRLGLINNQHQLLATVIQGKKFAEAANVPIRYVDIIFVAYGQISSEQYGVMKGICLEKDPQCGECQITSEYCSFRDSSQC